MNNRWWLFSILHCQTHHSPLINFKKHQNIIRISLFDVTRVAQFSSFQKISNTLFFLSLDTVMVMLHGHCHHHHHRKANQLFAQSLFIILCIFSLLGTLLIKHFSNINFYYCLICNQRFHSLSFIRSSSNNAHSHLIWAQP